MANWPPGWRMAAARQVQGLYQNKVKSPAAANYTG